jgi:predicted negative regulator of RcsB-dependent stress response
MEFNPKDADFKLAFQCSPRNIGPPFMDTSVPHLTTTDRLWSWYETNKQQAQLAILILVLLGIGVGYFLWHNSEKDVASGEALTTISLAQVGPSGTARAGSEDALLKVANDYPNSKAGARALLMAAGNLFVDGKYDQSKAQFEKFTHDYRESPFLGDALLGIAACLDAQNKQTEATAAYKSLVERHPSDTAVPQAKFALGRLYEAQNKPELARNMYEDVERAEPGTSVGSEAGMRVEELKRKFPSLAPSTPAAQPMFNAPVIKPK